MVKRVIISVISDVFSDQRIRKVANSLHNAGYDVQVIGRAKKNSPSIEGLPFSVKRLPMWFSSGPLLYAEFNIRLFFILLFTKGDIFNANDLDTLLANFLVAKLRRKTLVYDSHEYFTEVPEIQGRPWVKNSWETIEKLTLPAADQVYTVNDSIANIYSKQYKRTIQVIRNLPLLNNSFKSAAGRHELNLPPEQNILILQGAGINIDRGAEEALLSLQYLQNTLLLIIGSGDVLPYLKQLRKEKQLEDKVLILGRLPYEEMMPSTAAADLGLTLDKDTNLNYRYSLPNKFFDYLRAGIPVLSSKLVEIEKLIRKYQIGDTIDNHNPEAIAEKIRTIFSEPDTLNKWKNNTQTAIKDLSWEKEEPRLLEIYSRAGQKY